MPFVVLRLLSHANAHTYWVKRSGLGEIIDIKCEQAILEIPLTRVVAHTEVKPLKMSSSVRINSHVKVILPRHHLVNWVQIATLKRWVKSKLLTCPKIRVHPSKFPCLLLVGKLLFWQGDVGKVKLVRGNKTSFCCLFSIRESAMHLYWILVSRSQIKWLGGLTGYSIVAFSLKLAKFIAQRDSRTTRNHVLRFPALLNIVPNIWAPVFNQWLGAFKPTLDF